MILVLTGGGSGKDTEEIDKYFASLVDKSKPLLYIPIAIDIIKHPYPECLKWLRQTFDKFSISKYEMVTEDNIAKYCNKNPDNYGGIYIGGGNTPYLLKEIKESRITKLIEEAIDKNIPICGGSAGAIIFGKTIKSSLKADRNWVKLTDLTGLNKTQGWDIWCHYIKEHDKMIKDLLTKNKEIEKIIALTEKNAIIVNKKDIQIIGQEPALAIHNNIRKTVNVGEKIKSSLS